MQLSGERFDAHLLAAMTLLAEHSPSTATVRVGDGVAVAAVGAGGRPFNTGWVTGHPADPDGAVRWLREHLDPTGLGYCVQLAAPLLAHVAAALDAAGLVPEVTLPGMALPATGDVPPPPAGCRIVAVTDEPALEAHAVALSLGFGAPDARGALDVLVPSLLSDPRVTMFNGYLDGAAEPCATAVCVVAEGVAGVYAVTVHEHARRRGIGAAATWAAVAAGWRAGAPVAALQATAMGEPVYRRMGFTTTREYHRYVPA